MHKFISFNQQIISPENASIGAMSVAGLYGKSIFTTLAINDFKPFLWEKHWARLSNNAKKLAIDLTPFSERAVTAALDETLFVNKAKNARARITFFDETASEIWNFPAPRRTSLLITTADARKNLENLRLAVSPFRANSMSPLVNIKSGNYLEKILAFDEARKRGFDEAVQINERGEIVSACLANIFWLKNEKLFTPSLKTGCLAGTTREFLLENQRCAEVEASLTVLQEADAIFLTSAGLKIAQAAEFDGRFFDCREQKLTRII